MEGKLHLICLQFSAWRYHYNYSFEDCMTLNYVQAPHARRDSSEEILRVDVTSIEDQAVYL